MKKFSLVILFSISLVGCLQTRADLRGEAERPMQQQTRSQQQQQAQSQASQPPPKVVQASRFDEYDEQLRGLNGRIDNLENQVAVLNAGAQNDKSQISREKQDITNKFVAYEEALQKLEAQIAALRDEMAKQPVAAATAPVTAGKTGGATLHAEGQALFTGKKWKDAIVAFSKYRDQYPKGKLYGDATYKIGVSFQELGMKEEAKPFLEEVVAKFPGSKEAQKANYRLKTLK